MRILDIFDPEDRIKDHKLSHGYNNPKCDGDCQNCPYATC